MTLIQTLQALVESKDKTISLLEKEIQRLKSEKSINPLPSLPYVAPVPITHFSSPNNYPIINCNGPCSHQWREWGNDVTGGKTCEKCGTGAGWSST